MSLQPGSTPDSCRLALPSEARQLAAIQRRSWEAMFPAAVADHLLSALDLAAMTAEWEEAIQRPPLAQFRVLVATSRGRLVGFAAIGPSDDPDAHPAHDALVAEFVIDPPAQRGGHGSRLLNAVADTLRADGFERGTWWVRSTDDALRRFLESAGWGADGAHQTVATPGGEATIKLIRLHTDLSVS